MYKSNKSELKMANMEEVTRCITRESIWNVHEILRGNILSFVVAPNILVHRARP